jgi:hypothetical protein
MKWRVKLFCLELSTHTIFDYESGLRTLGPLFRAGRAGPEADLVREFLAQLSLRLPPRCRATVFREPRLESGFPDLVLVVWDVAKAALWSPYRAALLRDDVRLLHHLYVHHRRGITLKALSQFSPRQWPARVARLVAANLLRRQKHSYVPRALSYAFAVRQIIAIEAKVSQWAGALDQAFRNTWFASDSYILLPQQKFTRVVKAAAKCRGVRICWPGLAVAVRRTTSSNRLPLSYGSWLFNEWVWRFADAEGTVVV